MNKKLLMVIIPILVVIVAAIGVLSYLLLAEPSAEDLYLENIQTAQRFLNDGDVDQAILYYKSAIETDDEQEEPYLALARIYYEKKNDLKSALDILFEGYGKISTASIKSLMDEYLKLSDEQNKADEPVVEEAVNRIAIINPSLMDVFSTYTYGSYQDHYTLMNDQTSGGTYTVTYAQFDAEFEYKNVPDGPVVVDSTSGKPYKNVRPTAIHMKDLGKLISGVEQGITMADLTAYGGAQEIRLYKPDTEISTYYVGFFYRGCEFKIESDENGKITKADGFNAVIPPEAVSVSTTSTLTGFVLNADDNSHVKNATLNFRYGLNNRTGQVIESVSAPEGSYIVDLEVGDYTVEAIADGFITEFYTVYVPGGGTEITQSFVMSPKLQSNQMRFVVEWKNTQYDLYIHVKGQTSAGESLQYWEYGSSSNNVSQNLGDFKTGSQDGKRFTSATIKDAKGNYEFHVHGGKDQYSKQDLIASDVVVKIYKDNNSDPMLVTLPSTFPLEYWVVCRVHNGEIQLVD